MHCHIDWHFAAGLAVVFAEDPDTVATFTPPGPVGIEKVPDGQKLPLWSTRIILLGVTGTGKSNFLECIANDKTLGLSKDQLESVTDKIQCYKLLNVKKKTRIGRNGPIYVIDTPGFADRRLSEKKIVTMLHEWGMTSQDSLGIVVDRAMYFERITDTRASGSKKRARELFEMITGEKAASRIVIVTTMWDTLWNESQKNKAEVRFEEYKTSQWEKFTKKGTRCARFLNTQESAIHLLDEVLAQHLSIAGFAFSEKQYIGQEFQKAPYASFVLERLVERLMAVEGRLGGIEEELKLHHDDDGSNSRDVDWSADVVQELEREREELGALWSELNAELKDYKGNDVDPSADAPVKERSIRGIHRRVSEWLAGV
ncbi:hypothetical protein CVT24_003669 [Panaeolus cyanescens]|uniref:AIG1-type G domain-containing protein n=1 Tax=Panaeolus cyanescens TaxID=181874 RepID=A0A409W8D8_9AGAR|nr:hypothetical protein CVT24_003669 [Panaeolus cyanescens]